MRIICNIGKFENTKQLHVFFIRNSFIRAGGWSSLKVKKLSVLNFLVSDKLKNLFLKQNIFPLDFYTRYACDKILQFSHIDVNFIRIIKFDCQFRVSMGQSLQRLSYVIQMNSLFLILQRWRVSANKQLGLNTILKRKLNIKEPQPK